MNLYEKINEIRKAVEYIQKDKDVSTGGGSYKAFTHDAVTGILRKHLIEHGIICVPNLVASKANDRVGDAKQFRYDATYSFDFINAEAPTEKLTIILEAHAMDNADKAPGKAISYAKKYAVLKLFEIETGENEESRYQTTDVPVEFYVDLINAAKDMDELRKVFADGFGAANDAKDKDAAKIILSAKDRRKAELSKDAK